MWEAVAGAASSLLGGLFGDSAADKANAQQMDLAKNSISYRVADAKRAGIHPLYAIGAPTMSTTMQTSPMGNAIANAGQSIAKGIGKAGEADARALAMEQGKANIAKTLAETDYVNQQAAASKVQMLQASLTGAGGARPSKNADGTLDNPYPLYQYVKMPDGSIQKIANRDAFESSEIPGLIIDAKEYGQNKYKEFETYIHSKRKRTGGGRSW